LAGNLNRGRPISLKRVKIKTSGKEGMLFFSKEKFIPNTRKENPKKSGREVPRLSYRGGLIPGMSTTHKEIHSRNKEIASLKKKEKKHHIVVLNSEKRPTKSLPTGRGR